jgi:hypothetical protein
MQRRRPILYRLQIRKPSRNLSVVPEFRRPYRNGYVCNWITATQFAGTGKPLLWELRRETRAVRPMLNLWNEPDERKKPQARNSYLAFRRTAAAFLAFLATWTRLVGDRPGAFALPPLRRPMRPNGTAAGFFLPSGRIGAGSPTTSTRMEAASWFMSLDLRARLGILAEGLHTSAWLSNSNGSTTAFSRPAQLPQEREDVRTGDRKDDINPYPARPAMSRSNICREGENHD